MNDFATLPVILIFKGEENRIILSLTRAPCVGEYIHVNDPETDADEFLCRVLVVTHLGWNAQRPEAVAEVWCVRVPDTAADKLANHGGDGLSGF
jgi:hypothetical protein